MAACWFEALVHFVALVRTHMVVSSRSGNATICSVSHETSHFFLPKFAAHVLQGLRTLQCQDFLHVLSLTYKGAVLGVTLLRPY